VASKDHAGPAVEALLSRLLNPEVKSIGSSLKFCLVAEGRADLYPRFVPTMEWDTAAAQCVVENAGGRVLTLDGNDLRYGKPDWRNPAIITVGDAAFAWQELVSGAGMLKA
jgi:3'(2'), 5'-bisphosphate nucleotidase